MYLVIFGNMDKNNEFRMIEHDNVVGVDGLLYVDGRYSRSRLIDTCYERLRELQKRYKLASIKDVATCMKIGDEQWGLSSVWDNGELYNLW